MKIEIEIEDNDKEYFNVGFSFHDDKGNDIHFEELPYKKQMRIVNSFAKGYMVWKELLKKE